MNKLSLPPQRNKQPTEAEIEAVINKGGEVPKTAITLEPVATIEPKVQYVNARLTDEIIRQIDVLRAARPRKIGSPKLGVSLRDWVVEAVMDKLDRDMRKMQREREGK